MDEWIQLFNAETTEDLDMLEVSTKNTGILEAIKDVRGMSLRKRIRALYEGRQKEIRDRNCGTRVGMRDVTKAGMQGGAKARTDSTV